MIRCRLCEKPVKECACEVPPEVWALRVVLASHEVPEWAFVDETKEQQLGAWHEEPEILALR